MNNRTRMFNRQAGLTLTELMIAVALGLIVSAAVAGLFLQNKAVSLQSEEIGYIQDNGRYALKVLVDELKMSNYWGGYQAANRGSISVDGSVAIPTIDPVLGLAANCGPAGAAADWDYDLSNFIEYSTAANAVNDFTCITQDSTTLDAGTEVLMVKRTRGEPISLATNLTKGAPYLRTNRTIGTIHKATGSTSDPAAQYFDWQYHSRIYFIEGTTLKRWSLEVDPASAGNDPKYVKEEVAEGIEVFHIMFGIDNSSPWTDGVADFYTSAPTNAQLQQAVSARIYLLVRGSNEINGYKNDKSYQLGDLNVAAANDGYYRKVYSTTVLMKNTQTMLK